MKDYLRMLRVHHYIKNFLVFAVIVFGGQFTEISKLRSGLLGFLSFCAAASFIYIVNDIRDKEKDKLHPTKKNRPIASGRVSVRAALITACLCFVVSAVLLALVFNLFALILWGSFIILNILYSIGLKKIPLVDVSILVSGFLIRVVFGSAITDIAVSNWLYLTVISFSFFFAFGKRRNEIKQLGNSGTRDVLSGYTAAFLDKSMYMCLTLANVFYALWSIGEETVTHYHNSKMVFTVPVILLISLKYSMDIESEKSDGDPIEVLLHDKFLILLCFAYAAIMMGLLYVR